MDELRIRTHYLKGLIGSIVTKIVRKKTKSEISINVHEMEIESIGDDYYVKLGISGTIPKDDIPKLISKLNLL